MTATALRVLAAAHSIVEDGAADALTAQWARFIVTANPVVVETLVET